MRYPPDDTAGRSAGRRRSQQPGPGPGGQDASVFVPGYGTRRDQVPDGNAGDQARDGWHGSAAGKGPVRGYPPLPGQPPPMYPPGQFSAWNRREPGPARQASVGPAGASRGPGQAPDSARAADSGYYGRDGGPHTEPGYSVLAVSDPAADVTSTQTWQAVEDGRATGTWAAPDRPSRPGAPAGPAVRDSPGPPGQAASGRHSPWSSQAAAQRTGGPESGPLPPAGGTGLLERGTRPADRGTGDRGTVGPGTGGPGTGDRGTGDRGTVAPGTGGPGTGDRGTGDRGTGPGDRTGGRPGRRGAQAPGRRAAGTRSATTRATTAAAPAPGSTAPGTTAPGTSAPRSARKGSARRGKHPASAKLAVAGALVIVLVAGLALYLGARAASQRPRNAAQPKATASVAPPTPSPSPTLGVYGYIGTRQGDPTPLSVGQLYPASFAAGGATFTLTRARLSKDCIDAVNGANLQGTVSSSHCSQVARATYLAGKAGMMGTIGVLNLQTAKQAAKAARAAGAQNFIVQLPGRKRPTSRIGHGSGLEEALAKGHYLILIWAELTSLKTPHKGAQRTGLAQFMTHLFDSTANATLTDRMISGSPSPAA